MGQWNLGQWSNRNAALALVFLALLLAALAVFIGYAAADCDARGGVLVRDAVGRYVCVAPDLAPVLPGTR